MLNHRARRAGERLGFAGFNEDVSAIGSGVTTTEHAVVTTHPDTRASPRKIEFRVGIRTQDTQTHGAKLSSHNPGTSEASES
jgi:hypothetical protein